MTVVILEDAAEDLEFGAQFYQSCATDIGGEIENNRACLLILIIASARAFFSAVQNLAKPPRGERTCRYVACGQKVSERNLLLSLLAWWI